MYTEMALIARTFALTLVVAGVAAGGSIALAPAASADDEVPSTVVAQDDDRDDDDRDDNDVTDGPATVVHKSGRGGPDAFIILKHGKKPVFFCVAEKPKKQHNTCISLGGPTRF